MKPQQRKVRGGLRARASTPGPTSCLEANVFLLGLVFNQGQSAERSWQAPRLLFKRLRTSRMIAISRLDEPFLASVIAVRPALHRFPRVMARYVLGTTRLICSRYGGDARNIWNPSVGLKELLSRLSDVPGIGRHKAEVGVFFLTMEHHVPVLDDGTRIDLKMSCPRLLQTFYPLEDNVELPLVR